MQRETIDERKSESISLDEEQFANSDSPVRNHEDLFIDRPFSISPNTHPVNGNLDPDDEDEDEEEDEDDLILGDETAAGDEEEFDVELEDEFDEDDIDEDDLVIDSDDDIDEDDEEDDDL